MSNIYSFSSVLFVTVFVNFKFCTTIFLFVNVIVTFSSSSAVSVAVEILVLFLAFLFAVFAINPLLFESVITYDDM